MWLHISSGRGPAECELGVRLFYEYLCGLYGKMNKKLTLLDSMEGSRKAAYRSLICSADIVSDLKGGSVLWICKSPFRKNHQRKNWYIDFSILSEPENHNFSLGQVRIETKRSSGKGGQHVNKTESAVRITHLPTGITVTAGEERSQLLNRKLALARLAKELEELQNASQNEVKKKLWNQHNLLERGNPVMTFTGPDFLLKK